jgi:hypothetical protein
MTEYRARHAARGWRRWAGGAPAHAPARHRRVRRGGRRAVRAGVVVGVVALSALVGGVLLVAGGDGRGDDRPATRPAAASHTASTQLSGAGGAPAVERPARPEGAAAFDVPAPSPPVGVDIPSIGVSSPLVELGLGEDGAMEAPDDFAVAGWFTLGPQPGQPGPAVIAGHVDSRDGPAVFYRLAELVPGDEVIVHRADGSDVRFTVSRQRRYPKDQFPADAVYGPVPGPELRLITCGGEFDRSSRQYRDNVVVYATGPTSG